MSVARQSRAVWYTTISFSLVNRAKLVHNLFLVYLPISTCFRQLCAHHQEKQLCLCNTWYLLFCVGDCLVWRSICYYMTVWYGGAYAPAWLSGMEEHMLMHDCLVRRSICSCMTVWYGGAYAIVWLSGMEEHMLLYGCLVWRSICSCMTVWYGGAYAPAWLSCM